MKKITALVALLTVGIAAQASNDKSNNTESKKVAIVQNSSQKFKVVYIDKEQGKVNIDIANAEGDIVHSQKVENVDGFAQSYDFKSLPEGDYTFKITNPDGSKITRTVAFTKEISSPQFKANVLDVNDNNKFRLSVLKYNTDPVEIRIYDSKDRLLHTEKVTEAESFRKTFDLGKVNDKDIRFEIKNKKESVFLSSK